MDARENILLIRLKSIGDVILTLPAVNAIRDNFPSAKITYLTSKENATLLRGFREVNEIVVLDRSSFKSGNLLKASNSLFSLFRHLRQEHFSIAIDFQGYGETAWLSWFSGAPERWGSVYAKGREWLYTKAIKRNNHILIADWNVSLVRQCGLHINEIRNEYILPAEALAEARKFFTANNLDENKLTLFLQPFTSSPQKNWPLENYLAVARHWHAHGLQILFGGGPADCPRLEPARAAGYVITAGNPLLVSAGLVKLSTLTIGGVTGLLHLAVAMQKRVVMLIGPANEPGFPYQHRDWAVLPASGGNVSEIQISSVIEACECALGE